MLKTIKNNPKEMIYADIKPIDLSKIEFLNFPKSEYFAEEYEKRQIVLHHTISGPGYRGDIATWKRLKSRVATCIVIARDGIPYQLFSSKYWGWHLGVGTSNLDARSIAIELDNWGPLKKDGLNGYKTKTYGNKISSDAPVMKYPNNWRGEKYFEGYTEEQVRTTLELILYWHKTYGIPLDYKEDMWNVSERALNGEPGIWTHASFRPPKEKTDCHPYPKLIEGLKSLALNENI